MKKALAGSPKVFWELLKKAYSKYEDDKAYWMAAALAYYTIFSLAPLLIIVVTLTGTAFGEDAIKGEISLQIQRFIGSKGAQILETVALSAYKPGSGVFATIIAIAVILYGATNVFSQLQGKFNQIWKVRHKERHWVMTLVIERFIAFVMVLCVGFLVLLSIIIDTSITGFGEHISRFLPNPIYIILLQIGSLVFSFWMFVVLFALIYRTIPRTKVFWNDVWLGAMLASFLFTIGKIVMGLYLGKSMVVSAYGVAGSLIVLLFWFYYSAQILFFGAEISYVYAHEYGSRARSGK